MSTRFLVKPGDDEHSYHVVTSTFSKEGLSLGMRIISTFTSSDHGEAEANRYAACLNAGVNQFLKGSCPTNDEQEIIVELKDGCTIRSGCYNPDEDSLMGGEYVRVCDESGEEILYYDSQEWVEDPILVMGAFLNCAAGLRMHINVDSD